MRTRTRIKKNITAALDPTSIDLITQKGINERKRINTVILKAIVGGTAPNSKTVLAAIVPMSPFDLVITRMKNNTLTKAMMRTRARPKKNVTAAQDPTSIDQTT